MLFWALNKFYYQLSCLILGKSRYLARFLKEHLQKNYMYKLKILLKLEIFYENSYDFFEGRFGDHKQVSDHVWELRWENGRRIYCSLIPVSQVLLLLGGNKNGQTKDINQLKLLEPDQYFYPSTDRHITLQVMATGNNQFNSENLTICYYGKPCLVNLSMNLEKWYALKKSWQRT